MKRDQKKQEKREKRLEFGERVKPIQSPQDSQPAFDMSEI